MSVEKDPNGNKFIPYMREDRLPHIFCPGCAKEWKKLKWILII